MPDSERSFREEIMDFGYFTLSDNHYENNHAHVEPVRRRHHRRGAVCRQARHALGLDRRASFQLARRAVLSRSGARPTSPPTPSTSAWRRRSRCCRCIIRSASPSNGRRSICSPTAASISPAAAVTTGANTSRSMCRSTTTRRSSKKGWNGAAAVGGRGPDLASRQVLFVRRCADHAAAGAAADPDLCRVVLEAVDRACGASGLRTDRRAFRRGDELRRAQAGGGPVSRELRASTAQSRAG